MSKLPASTETDLGRFLEFLRAHLIEFKTSGGSGENLSFPDYDLMPHDYLRYAEEALASPTDANRINCISHLKRAAECECDTLLYVLNLKSKIGKLSFPQKLEFIDCLNLMPSRSISKINRIRNAVEHEYSAPTVDDLEVYFDLVAGFISAVEGALYMLGSSAISEWEQDHKDNRSPFFTSGYHIEESTVTFNYSLDGRTCDCHITPDRWEVFKESLGVVFLLIRHQHLVSVDYVLDNLPKRAEQAEQTTPRKMSD